MDKIKIATDSTADIPKQLCQELDIAVLPLSILYKGQEYLDSVDVEPEEFYHWLENPDELPVSAQASLMRLKELYETTWQQGYSDLVQVTLNSKGSGTYQAAVLARSTFYEDHPEAEANFRIHLIDSRTYSMAYGIPVVEAARMNQAGKSLEEILAHIKDWLEHTRPLFIPLDLKCVKRSGRVSAAAAFVGDALGLKPLITFEDGESKILGKVRGENKAVSLLVETCLKERKPGSNYALLYGNNLAAFAKVKEACAKVMDIPPMVERPVGCIISINTGPNLIAIIYRV